MTSYRVAMLAYPRPYRRHNGAEIVDTANELADGRWSARQSGALLMEGLRTRARLSTGGSTRQALASGIALGVALFSLVSLSSFVLIGLGGPGDLLDSWQPLVGLAVGLVPLTVLTVTTRWPAVAAACVPLGIPFLETRDPYSLGINWPVFLLNHVPVVLLVGLVALKGDDRRALSPRLALGLVTLTLGVGWVASPLLAMQITGYAVLLMLPLLGLATVWLDPRLLAAGSAVGLLWVANVAAALVIEGLDSFGAYMVLTAVMLGLALLGLALAGAAGRRTLSVTR